MTPQQIKALQDSLVKQGYMTQAQVDTGYGIYGPKTTAAYAKYQADVNSAAAAHPVVGPAIQKYGSVDQALSAAGGTVTNLQDAYGTPFSGADQAAAVNQATQEGQPFFEAQKQKAMQDAAASLANEQSQYGAYQANQARQFQADKQTQDQTAASQGVLFSGGRAQKLANLGATYTTDQAAKLAQLGANVGQTARDFQYKYGNDAAQNLSQYYTAGGNVYNPNVAQGGATQGALSSIYNPGASNFQGTEVNAAKAAAQQRAAGLLWNKGNKILPLGYKNQY
jgi:hypothetical protein